VEDFQKRNYSHKMERRLSNFSKIRKLFWFQQILAYGESNEIP
jgi:hypothetical protein